MQTRRVFIRQIGLGTAGMMLGGSSLASVNHFPATGNLPRSVPEMQGVSSESIHRLLDALDNSGIEFHSIMIVRNGFVIAEAWWAPYAPEYRHTLHSLSKSFTSAAVGLAIHEGHFTVDSPVISFFPDLLPKEISPNLSAMKVKHLLTMTSGHAADNGLRTDHLPWVQSFLAAPIVYAPGSFYMYNTSATYMLSAIVQKTTGKNLLDYLKPRLLDPLKIEGADWEMSPQGIHTGGYGLRIRTEDIASFSQLYLNKGKWKGQQIIPEAWVEDSGKAQWVFASNPFGGKTPKQDDDWQQGYGYQFWRTKHNGYRSDGLYGQFGIVLPDEQMVVAITEQSFNTQKTLNLIWDNLLPGLQKNALAPNSNALKKLTDRQAGLGISPVIAAGIPSSLVTEISGKKFLLNDNVLGAKSVMFNFTSDSCSLTVSYDDGDRKLHFGMNRWEKAKNGTMLNKQLPFPVLKLPNVDSVIAGMAVWKAPDILYVEIRPVETVTGDSITCSFTNNTVQLAFLHTVAKAGKEQETRPLITGSIA
ncbi:MAG: hypothetical protein RLZZ28_1185 [Bacteroidota bacterium]